MSSNRNVQLNRFTAGIIVFMMLFIVLGSSYYIAAEAGHECLGEDCPICECIHECENTLFRCMGAAGTTMAVTCIPVLLLAVIINVFTCIIKQESLVSRKIRLND